MGLCVHLRRGGVLSCVRSQDGGFSVLQSAERIKSTKELSSYCTAGEIAPAPAMRQPRGQAREVMAEVEELLLRVGGKKYFGRAGGEQRAGDWRWRLLTLSVAARPSFPQQSSQPLSLLTSSLPSSFRLPHQPPMSIHGNLSKRPPLDGTVHIDTQESSAQPSNNNDVAGVLRRNQACLQCRRRKLACCLLLW